MIPHTSQYPGPGVWTRTSLGGWSGTTSLRGCPSGYPPQNYVCTRMHLGRGGEPTSSISQCRGLWSNQETSLHIKILEMKALFLALQAFQDMITSQRVTPMCDNSTVVAYVNKRGDSIRLPLRVDRATSPLDRSPQRDPGSEVPPGTIERPSRPPQPPEPSAGCRVVPLPAGSEEDHPQVGVADHRPVCDPPQCEASALLLPNPRPTSCL